MASHAGGQPPMDRAAQTAIRRRLRLLVREKGGTPARLARQIGVPASTVRGWMKDKTPSVTHILAIARQLNVSPSWLLLGDEPQLRRADPAPRSTADSFWEVMRQHCRTVLVADGIPDEYADAIVSQFFLNQREFSATTGQRLFEFELEKWMEFRNAGVRAESHAQRMAALREAIGAPEPRRSPLLPWPPPAELGEDGLDLYRKPLAEQIAATGADGAHLPPDNVKGRPTRSGPKKPKR